MESITEVAQYFVDASLMLQSSKTSDDLQMVQKQPERFHPQETWMKFLTAIPQLSLPKAQAIVNQYPNLNSLMIAFEAAPASKRETLLMNITAGSMPIGKALSSKIYLYLTTTDPLNIL